jgi:hypothetical protein
MSMTGIMCGQFEDAVAKLVEQTFAALDGLNVAGILQRAATKALKECSNGDLDDGRTKACLDILDEARREFIEDAAAAKEREKQWRESVAAEGSWTDGF